MKKLLLISMLYLPEILCAQIPVEVFAGHQKTTIDVMFFKYFKNKKKENSPCLFFNRNRASVDYRMTKKTYLPQFGFTEAVSYNHPKLKGFAPVAVVQVLSWDVLPKAGIQYALIKKNLTIFSWVVSETLKEPDIDFFLLTRYTPKISGKVNLFAQFEAVSVFPTLRNGNFNFTQRARLGLKITEWQFGAGADYNETGNKKFLNTNNFGGFLRYEF